MISPRLRCIRGIRCWEEEEEEEEEAEEEEEEEEKMMMMMLNKMYVPLPFVHNVKHLVALK
jgi:CO dehydrogenase/acetyl-CoA synthase beta subunit